MIGSLAISLTFIFSHHTAGLRFLTSSFEDITRSCIQEGKFSKFLDFNDPASYVRLDMGKKTNQTTFDCDIEVQTVLRTLGDKQMVEMEALSLIILELNYSSPRQEYIQVITNSYFGQKTVTVSQEASYGTNRIWTNNPTFLLSGQLTGFDPIDSRHRTRHIIHEQHVYPPDRIFSKFDTPASIQVRLRKWTETSKLYLIFTSYKLLTNGEQCTEGAEYECPTTSEFKKKTGRLCMAYTLACDGLPNCGDNQIPNPDEACFKIHWSNVLLSLVSYILLAITLLLCMSCFARILIQWSVRSSQYEMRADSIRSSSRLFSFFGGSFSRRWERPPPTYDEALKHFNPDSGHRPPNPPPYSDNFRTRFPLSRSLEAIRTAPTGVVSGVQTPPPDYSSCEDLRPRPLLGDSPTEPSSISSENSNNGLGISRTVNRVRKVVPPTNLPPLPPLPSRSHQAQNLVKPLYHAVSQAPAPAKSGLRATASNNSTISSTSCSSSSSSSSNAVPAKLSFNSDNNGRRSRRKDRMCQHKEVRMEFHSNSLDLVSPQNETIGSPSGVGSGMVVRTSQSGLIPDTPLLGLAGGGLVGELFLATADNSGGRADNCGELGHEEVGEDEEEDEDEEDEEGEEEEAALVPRRNSREVGSLQAGPRREVVGTGLFPQHRTSKSGLLLDETDDLSCYLDIPCLSTTSSAPASAAAAAAAPAVPAHLGHMGVGGGSMGVTPEDKILYHQQPQQQQQHKHQQQQHKHRQHQHKHHHRQ